jgi:kynurenine formamidase
MVIDLTLPIENDMPLFPGLPSFTSESIVAEDTGAITHRICMSTHQGTHVDAPRHFFEGGKTIDEIRLERLCGEAVVFDLRKHRGEPITVETLSSTGNDIVEEDIVVLITGDVDRHFYKGNFFDTASTLTTDAAEWLVDRGVSVVANDFLTEALEKPGRPVHNTLLGAEVPIVEYLCNTAAIADRETVQFVCVPLRLMDLDGSPARVFIPE